MDKLPSELHQKIYSFLDDYSKANLQRTSQRFAALASSSEDLGLPSPADELQTILAFRETHRTPEYDRRHDRFTGRSFQLVGREAWQNGAGVAAANAAALQPIPAFKTTLKALDHFSARMTAALAPGEQPMTGVEICKAAARLLRGRAELGYFADHAELGFLDHAPRWCWEMGARTGMETAPEQSSAAPIHLSPFDDRSVTNLVMDHPELVPSHLSFWLVRGRQNPETQGAVYALSLRAIAEVARSSGTPNGDVDLFLGHINNFLVTQVQSFKAGDGGYADSLPLRYGNPHNDLFADKWLAGASLVLTAK